MATCAFGHWKQTSGGSQDWSGFPQNTASKTGHRQSAVTLFFSFSFFWLRFPASFHKSDGVKMKSNTSGGFPSLTHSFLQHSGAESKPSPPSFFIIHSFLFYLSIRHFLSFLSHLLLSFTFFSHLLTVPFSSNMLTMHSFPQLPYNHPSEYKFMDTGN